MAKILYTAICFFPKEQQKLPYKYKNVSTPGTLGNYMRRKGAEYINFYDSKTRAYAFRLYLNPHYQWRREETEKKIDQSKNINLSKFLKK